ncbi:MAG: DUF547 domain-containing protein [Bacteroidota bacterium]|nr:DUF547 domain-containing protein [Bacteroidota bacterium]
MKYLLTALKFWVVAVVLLHALPVGAQRARKAAAPPAAVFTARTTAFLRQHVNKNGRVNYAAIQRNPDQLDALLFTIAGFDAAHASAPDQYAFYLNAYNVLVIGDIVRNYPLKSVQDMPGFFNKTLHRVGGEQLTLDQIETDKLRHIYDDPRLHFALVCGTQSCPPLRRIAYAGAELGAQLDIQARLALANPAYVLVNPGVGLVQLPEILKWYEADFSASGQTGVGYVNQFRKAGRTAVPAWFAVEYYPHNWSLNDQARQ